MRINKAKSWFYGNDTPGNIHEREKKNKNKHYQKLKRNRPIKVVGIERQQEDI